MKQLLKYLNLDKHYHPKSKIISYLVTIDVLFFGWLSLVSLKGFYYGSPSVHLWVLAIELFLTIVPAKFLFTEHKHKHYKLYHICVVFGFILSILLFGALLWMVR